MLKEEFGVGEFSLSSNVGVTVFRGILSGEILIGFAEAPEEVAGTGGRMGERTGALKGDLVKGTSL